MSIIELDRQFLFYASYHHDKINKLIHIVFVWPLLWSALVFLQYTPQFQFISLAPLDPLAIHPLNGAFFVALFYAGAYILMEQKGAGIAAGALVFITLLASSKFYQTAHLHCGYPAWILAVVIHICCWGFQFYGHGKFEGRAPALMDNLAQAFLMAPLFVFLEVLFTWGYRKDFQARIWKQAEIEIAIFRESQKSEAAKAKKRSLLKSCIHWFFKAN